MIEAVGHVVSGRGLAKEHIARLDGDLRRHTGHAIYPGSLNVILARPLMLRLETALALENGRRLVWPATINDVPVWIYRWCHAPLHIVEVLSDLYLRQYLGLEDRAPVRIGVERTHVARVAATSRAVWSALWLGRQDWYYRKDGYVARTREFGRIGGGTQEGATGGPIKTVGRLGRYLVRQMPLIGPLATRAGRALKARRAPKARPRPPYVFTRESPAADATPEALLRQQIQNVLNYAKTADTAYAAAMYPAGYHAVEVLGQRLAGQRDPDLRLRQVPFDFRGRTVLDIGTNQGGMLFALADRIAAGVGVDLDSRKINAANRLNALAPVRNLGFYVFDLEREPLALLQDFVPGGRADIVFFLSMVAWVANWREVVAFCPRLAERLLFESHGTEAQQAEQEQVLRRHYGQVRRLADASTDDPGYTRRRLYLCEGGAA